MSIHSYVQSNITDYGTLTAILNENGVQWWPVNRRHSGRCSFHALQRGTAGWGADICRVLARLLPALFLLLQTR